MFCNQTGIIGRWRATVKRGYEYIMNHQGQTRDRDNYVTKLIDWGQACPQVWALLARARRLFYVSQMQSVSCRVKRVQ